jgi:hypothetical protein
MAKLTLALPYWRTVYQVPSFTSAGAWHTGREPFIASMVIIPL